MLSTGAIAAVFVAVWLCGVDLLWVLMTNEALNPGPRRTALRALFGGRAGLVVFSVFTLTGPSGVGARILTGPHVPNCRARHLPMRYEAGLPSSVNRFRMLHARMASLPCPAGLRARRASP